MTGEPTWLAFATSGVSNGDGVLVIGDTVWDLRDGRLVTTQTATGLGALVGTARQLRLGWAEFDDVEVVYLDDTADDNVGYAVHLQLEWCSAWGYAPFTT